MPDRHARDRFGRPVDADSPDAFPSVPERSDISADEAWAGAMAYLEVGLPFHAHEVFEQRWRCCPDGERAQWQAFARWCAALTQAARGNADSARSMALSILDEISQISESAPVRLDEVQWNAVRSSLETLT